GGPARRCRCRRSGPCARRRIRRPVGPGRRRRTPDRRTAGLQAPGPPGRSFTTIHLLFYNVGTGTVKRPRGTLVSTRARCQREVRGDADGGGAAQGRGRAGRGVCEGGPE